MNVRMSGLSFGVCLLMVVLLAPSVATGRTPLPEPRIVVKMPGVAGIAPGDLGRVNWRAKHLAPPTEVITFGRIDQTTGEIVEGKYLIWVKLELDTAPLSSLEFFASDPFVNPPAIKSYIVTPSQPSIEFLTTINLPGGFGGGNLTGADIFLTTSATAEVGDIGQAKISWALIDNPEARIRRAPGVSSTIDVLITDITDSSNASMAQWQLIRIGKAVGR